MRYILVSLFLALNLSFAAAEQQESVVTLVDHGMHMGIIVSKRDIEASWPELSEAYPNFDFYEFGMGEEPFFREADHSLWGGAKAMFIPTNSITRLHPFSGTVDKYYDGNNLAAFKASSDKVASMVKWMKKDMLDKLDLVEAQEKNPYYFFKRQGSYHFFNNCNHWVADAFEHLDIEIGWSEKLWSSRMFDALSKKAFSKKKPYTKGSWQTTFDKYL